MKGTILSYDVTTHSGKISGYDGNRYSFIRQDWSGNNTPKEGIEVDFENEGQNAKDIIPIKKINSGSSGHKDKTVAALLALFLGGIGIHKFYLGRGTQGVLYILFFWTFIPAIIAFFEGIIYLTKSEEAFNDLYN